MSTAEISREGSKDVVELETRWDEPNNVYQLEVVLCPEDGGGFSIHAIKLPGAVSQGETEEEALANIREACAGVIKAYLARDGKIPWMPVDIEECPGAKPFRVMVNA